MEQEIKDPFKKLGLIKPVKPEDTTATSVEQSNILMPEKISTGTLDEQPSVDDPFKKLGLNKPGEPVSDEKEDSEEVEFEMGGLWNRLKNVHKQTRETLESLKSEEAQQEIAKNMEMINTRGELSPNNAVLKAVQDSYVFKAGFNQSLIGLGYTVATGDELFEIDPNYDPSLLEEIAAIGWGFLLDAPAFILSGGIGSTVAKLTTTNAAKYISNYGGKKLVNNLVKKGVKKEVAEKAVKAGATKYSKILQKLTTGIPEKTTGLAGSIEKLAGSATALGGYNSLSTALYLLGNSNEPLSKSEWDLIMEEGLIGAKMGIGLGLLGMGGKYIESVINRSITSNALRYAALGGEKVASTGAEVGFFALADPYLRDEPITGDNWLEAAKMVAGVKLSGAVQKLPFIRSKFFSDKKINKDDFKFEPEAIEKKLLEKHRPKDYVGDISEVVIRDEKVFTDVLADPEIPLLTKGKLIYSKTGYFPEVFPNIAKIDLKETKDKVLLTVYGEDNTLLDAKAFSDKETANMYADFLVDFTLDMQRKAAFKELPLKDKKKLKSAIQENNISIDKLTDAWDTSVSLRNYDQSVLVTKFYDIWDKTLGKKEQTTEGEKVKPVVDEDKVFIKEEEKKKVSEIKGEEKKSVIEKEEQIKAEDKEIKKEVDKDILNELKEEELETLREERIQREEELKKKNKFTDEEKEKIKIEYENKEKEIDDRYKNIEVNQEQRTELSERLNKEVIRSDAVKATDDGFTIRIKERNQILEVNTKEDVKRAEDFLDSWEIDVRKELENRKNIDYDDPSIKYALFGTAYKTKQEFLNAFKKAAEKNVISFRTLASDVKVDPKELSDIDLMRIVDKYAPKEGRAPKELPLEFQSTDELYTGLDRISYFRKSLQEIDKYVIPEDVYEKKVVAENINKLRKESNDLVKNISLAAAAKEKFEISEDPKINILKLLRTQKKLTENEAKRIRSMLDGFLKANRKELNRLKIPLKTTILRDVNNIRPNKTGWKDVGMVIKKITKMMEDKKYRDEQIKRANLRKKIERELRPRIFTTGKPGKTETAKPSYKAGEVSAKVISYLKELNKIVKDVSDPDTGSEKAMKYIKEMEDIFQIGEMRLTNPDLTKWAPETEQFDGNGLTAAERKRLFALNFSQIYDMDSRTLENLLKYVKDFKKTGREFAEKWHELRQKEREARDSKTLEYIIPKGKELTYGPNRRIRKLNAIEHIGVWDGSFKSVLSGIARGREIKEGEESYAAFMGPLENLYVPHVTKSEEGSAKDRVDLGHALRDAQERIFSGLNRAELKIKLMKYALPEKSPVEYIDPDGNKRYIEMSQRQGLHMWLIAQQDGTEATFLKPLTKDFKGMGWTENSFKQLDEWLDPQLKEYGLWMRDIMSEYKRLKVDDVFVSERGVFLEDIENYWSIFRHKTHNFSHNSDILDKNRYPTRVISDRHKLRTASDDPFVYMDALEVFDRYMHDQIHYANWAKTVRILDESFKMNPHIREAILQFHGDYYLDTIHWFNDRFAGRSLSDNLNFLDGIINRLSKGTLFLSRSVGIKQTISSMMYLIDMDVGSLTTGMAKMMATKEGKELSEVLFRHSFLQARNEAYLNQDAAYSLRQATKKIKHPTTELGKKVQRARISYQSLKPIIADPLENITSFTLTAGDRFPIVYAGGAYIMNLIKKDGKNWSQIKREAARLAKKEGLLYEDALDKVMKPYTDRWAILSEFTQQSTRLSNISRARANSITRALAMFTSGAAQIHRFSIASLKEGLNAAKQGRTDIAKKHFRNFALSWGLMGSTFTLIENGFRWDWEDQIMGLVMGNMNGVAVVGRMVDFIADSIMDKPWADKSTLTPIYDTFKGIVRSYRNIEQAYKVGDEERMKKNAFRLVEYLSQFAGIQLKQAVGVVEDANMVLNAATGGDGATDAPVRTMLGIYNPAYTPALEIWEIFSKEEIEEARREEAFIESLRKKGLSKAEIAEARKRFREKNR